MSHGLLASRADARTDPLTAGEESLAYAGRQDAMTITGELAGAREQGVAITRVLSLLDALVFRHARGSPAAPAESADSLAAYVRRRALAEYGRAGD